eukprot:COSAG02_NODE_3395_length_6814_cov_8.576620_2_plen_31_part_00
MFSILYMYTGRLEPTKIEGTVCIPGPDAGS